MSKYFEFKWFLYYNKYVYYNAVPKQDNDGLTDYLNYFNIDDNISQELKITKEEVYNKLIKFDSDNKILNILGQWIIIWKLY